jgi:esterase/lipase
LQSVGDLAVYFDMQTMGHSPMLLRDVQLGAILAANKRLLGYIIIAGLGVLTFVLFHSFGDAQRALFPAAAIDVNSVQKILNIVKKKTKEVHERNKKLSAAQKRHRKERHAEATSQIPRLVEKLKHVDGAWNKIKVIFKYIPASIKESIEKEKQRNKELREIRRSGNNNNN